MAPIFNGLAALSEDGSMARVLAWPIRAFCSLLVCSAPGFRHRNVETSGPLCPFFTPRAFSLRPRSPRQDFSCRGRTHGPNAWAERMGRFTCHRDRIVSLAQSPSPSESPASTSGRKRCTGGGMGTSAPFTLFQIISFNACMGARSTSEKSIFMLSCAP